MPEIDWVIGTKPVKSMETGVPTTVERSTNARAVAGLPRTHYEVLLGAS